MATIRYVENGVTNVVYFDATMSESHGRTAEITEHVVERGADLADHVRPSRPDFSMDVMVSNTPIPNRGKPPEGRIIGQKVLTFFQSPEQIRNSLDVNRAVFPPSIKGGYVAPFSLPLNGGRVGLTTPGGNGPADISTVGSNGNSSSRITYPWVVTPGSYSANRVQGLWAEVFTYLEAQDRVQDIWTALNGLLERAQVLTVVTRLQEYPSMLIAGIGAPVEARNAITFSLRFKQVGFAESLTFANAVAPVAANAKKAVAKKDQGPKATFTMEDTRGQSLVDMKMQSLAGYRTPDEVLADHPNPR